MSLGECCLCELVREVSAKRVGRYVGTYLGNFWPGVPSVRRRFSIINLVGTVDQAFGNKVE